MPKLMFKMKGQAQAYILVIILLTASHSICSAAIIIQAVDSVDFRLGPAKPRMSTASRYILATWVSKVCNIKSRRQLKDNTHKVPSGPNPIGNRHPPSKP